MNCGNILFESKAKSNGMKIGEMPDGSDVVVDIGNINGLRFVDSDLARQKQMLTCFVSRLLESNEYDVVLIGWHLGFDDVPNVTFVDRSGFEKTLQDVYAETLERFSLMKKTLAPNIVEYNLTTEQPKKQICMILGDDICDSVILGNEQQRMLNGILSFGRVAGVHVVTYHYKDSPKLLNTVLEENCKHTVDFYEYEEVCKCKQNVTMIDSVAKFMQQNKDVNAEQIQRHFGLSKIQAEFYFENSCKCKR